MRNTSLAHMRQELDGTGPLTLSVNSSTLHTSSLTGYRRRASKVRNEMAEQGCDPGRQGPSPGISELLDLALRPIGEHGGTAALRRPKQPAFAVVLIPADSSSLQRLCLRVMSRHDGPASAAAIATLLPASPDEQETAERKVRDTRRQLKQFQKVRAHAPWLDAVRSSASTC